MMMRKSWWSCWLAIAVVAGLASSGALLAESPPAKVLSLRLAPENPTLWGTKAAQRFLVLAEYSDGLEREVTSQSPLFGYGCGGGGGR